MKYSVLIGAFVLMGSAAGWAGQEVYSPVAMALALVLGLATAALFAYRKKQLDPSARAWPMAPVWGVLLAGGLYFAGTSLWTANDVLLNSNWYLGARQMLEKSALGVALGLGVGLIVAWYVRTPQRRWTRGLRSVTLAGWIALAVSGGLLFWLRTGVRDRALYPPREQSPYKLPWPGGETWTCTQGNWAILRHRGDTPYAWDFPMPIGSPVCAAREGKVIGVVDHHDGNGLRKPGNGVTILHADGTYAIYWHIRQGGSLVRKGEKVKQGEVIAESGNVGYSTSPHLHFEVYDQMWRSMPISFRDVEILGGIPRLGLRYTSGNYPR